MEDGAEGLTGEGDGEGKKVEYGHLVTILGEPVVEDADKLRADKDKIVRELHALQSTQQGSPVWERWNNIKEFLDMPKGMWNQQHPGEKTVTFPATIKPKS